jgi:uncharacterized cupredoxin-like copper-binding protein
MRRNTLIATAITAAAATIVGVTGLSVGAVSAVNGMAPRAGNFVGSSCTPPQLDGSVVTVSLADMGGSMMGGNNGMMGGYNGMMGDYNGMMGGNAGMMGGNAGMMGGNAGNRVTPRGFMSLNLDRSSVASGTTSLLGTNYGSISHELVVVPLTESQVAGGRAISRDGTVDEAASLGEASATCDAGEGSGIVPGSAGWVTLDLKPGRYEVLCNLPGHYAAGMYEELTVS